MTATTEKTLQRALDQTYEALEGSESLERYSVRHGIESLGILTVTDDECAWKIAALLAPKIENKIVIEIGGGIGLLAFHMAQYAKRVYVIEAHPAWSAIHIFMMLEKKPKNVTFIFGAADELAGQIRGDIAVFCTHSGAEAMRQAGLLLARDCIDIYQDLGLLDSAEPELLNARNASIRQVAEQS